MAGITTFINGNEGSAQDWQNTINAIQAQGEAVLDGLNTVRNDTYTAMLRRVSSINGKLSVSKALLDNNAVAVFSISDFNLIDQSETTATVRVDANAVTLSERSFEVDAVIKSVVFSSSIGSIETIDSNYNTYRVYNTLNQTPTGVFDIILRATLNLSVMVFDLAAFAGDPTITIQTSDTGLIYKDVDKIQLNGYRLIAWLSAADVQYIKMSITPSMPDNLGGSLYTFGVTDFSASSTEFRLLSEFVSRPLSFIAESPSVQLLGSSGSGLVYFISFNGGPFIEIANGDTIDLPGVSTTNTTGITIDNTGLLATQLPANGSTGFVQPYTIQVIDEQTGLNVPVVRGIQPNSSNLSKLSGKFISIVGTSLYYIPYNSTDASSTFKLSYLYGQTSISAVLKVQLSSSSNNTSPIFNGASLLKV